MFKKNHFHTICHLHKIVIYILQVLVVGNPANTNAFICKKYAPTIPAQNFSALTRLDQNRAQAQVSQPVLLLFSFFFQRILFILGNTIWPLDYFSLQLSRTIASKFVLLMCWLKSGHRTVVRTSTDIYLYYMICLK